MVSDPYRIFAFNAWANLCCLDSIPDNTDREDKRLVLFSHILGAHRLWFARIDRPDYESDEYRELIHKLQCHYSLNECRDNMLELERITAEFLSNAVPDRLSEVVPYRNIRGDSFTMPIADILYHIVNHGSYHRGQIASLVRAAGGTPAVTDYMYFAAVVINVSK